MLQTISNLLPVASTLLSLYILLLLKNERDDNSLIEHNQELIEKYILKNKKNINTVVKELNKLKESVSSLKFRFANDFKTIESKIDDLYERWKIVADDRITSIPQNSKEWYDAKLIVAQAPQKVWKAKNLSQTKSGFINENTKYNEIEEDELNQDFSKLSDEDFASILDEEESDDTSSSSATDHLQEQKPKRKKTKQQTM